MPKTITGSNFSSTCRICGRKTNTYLTEVRGHNLEKCPRCSFVQVAERPDPQELEDIYREDYFNHGKYRDQETLQVENLRRLDMLLESIKEESSVLEVGCGEGSFINLAKNSYQLTGFDLSESGIKKAREQNPKIADRIWVGSIEEQSELNDKFDAICMWDVLEHIWDPAPTCNKLLEMLEPGGKLYISTPNINTVIAGLLKKRWAFMTPPEHLSFFSPKSIRYLFEKKLKARVIYLRSRGKKVNLGFLFYKINRVFPKFPSGILKWVEKSPALAKAAIYIPTGDIQYIVIEKGS